MKSKFISVLICTLFFSIIMCGENSDSLELVKLSEEIAKLQSQVDSIAVESNGLEKIIEDLNKYISTPSLIFRDFSILILLSLAIFVVGVLAIWRLLLWISPKWYEKLIQKLIERYEEVNRLKREKRILVLLPEGNTSNVEFVESFFRAKSFERVDQERISKYIKPRKQYDVFFVYDEKKEIAQSVLEQYLFEHPYSCLFCFYPPGGWDFKTTDQDSLKRLNLTNVRAQIYGNFISTLKYHDITVPIVRS